MFEWYVTCALYVVFYFALSYMLKQLFVKGMVRNPRKVVHILMGIAVMASPFLSKEQNVLGTCFALVIIEISLISLRRRVRKGENEAGKILYDKGRLYSVGELLHPITMILLLILSAHREPLFFFYPLLILTFSDPAAEAAGKKYGKHVISSGSEDCKSWEGSLVFLFVSVIIGEVCYCHYGGVQLKWILAAFFSAMVCTCIEAVSSHGMDNLMTVIASYSIAAQSVREEPVFIILCMGIGVASFVIFEMCQRWSRFSMLEQIQLSVLMVLSVYCIGLFMIVPFTGWVILRAAVERKLFLHTVIDNKTAIGSYIFFMICLLFPSSLFQQTVCITGVLLVYALQCIWRYFRGSFEIREDPGDRNNQMIIRILLVLRKETRASCSLWIKKCHSGHENRCFSAFGKFQAEDQKCGEKLLRYASVLSFFKGAEYIVGPMDGNTWYPYRCTLKHREKPFYMESLTPLLYHKCFENTGFYREHTYYSSRSLLGMENRKYIMALQPVENYLKKRNICIKNAEEYDFESLMKIMYEISLSAFKDNYYFEHIGFNEFSRMFSKNKEGLMKEYFFIAYDRNKPVGFLFCVPNYNEKTNLGRINTIIFKTFGILPEYQKQNVALGLIAHACRVSLEKGMSSVINAYYCRENKKIFDAIASIPVKAEVISEYALYRKELLE